ncbi:hypothetical protein ASF32_21150 [Methylobacterium sp. Leaf91]|nr:hypothetical protein ASF24_17890 [Methylobacterium sp. Leaf86]KQO93657.1 hypothetical protein ASF32_21150 [Methylobacterium sp. Leaf91]
MDAFCDLPAQPDIDTVLEDAERSFAAAMAEAAVRERPIFAPLALPTFDLEGIEAVLARDLPGLEAAAAERAQAHLSALGKGAEAWVAEGMMKIADGAASGDLEACPFCAQNLSGSPLIAHYQAYFSDAYAELKAAITAAGKAVRATHPDEVPADFERHVRVASETREFWSDFVRVPTFQLDTAAISRAWREAREGMLTALRAKYAAPLEPTSLSPTVRAAVSSYEEYRAVVDIVSAALQETNGEIELVREKAALANLSTLEAALPRLYAVRSRHTPEVAAACNAYLAEKVAKDVTVRLRTDARTALDAYRNAVFPAYETAINTYLSRFGAGFRLGSVRQANNRGGSTCTYNVLINTIAVSVPSSSGPSFRNTLSAGDRNVLALAFFFASLHNDSDIGRKIVVIDDPMTSLDEHRNLHTLNEMKRLLGRVDQMIVLSHSKPFLCPLWESTTTNDRAAIKIGRIRTQQNEDASDLTEWNVHADCISEHDHRHGLVRSYLQNSASADERAVAEALRLILEAFVRVAYPADFKPGDALGAFVNVSRQRLGTRGQIMNQVDTDELREILEYANQFHHDTKTTRGTVFINGTELADLATRTLAFTRRT